MRASGSTAAPLAGAGLGLAAAAALCWLLYRRAVRLNVGVFFSRTAVALIVIAAGVLSAGLGDLQDAALLPGQHWVLFDLTTHVDPSSWWVSLLTGITDLTPKMTVLQAVAWVTYLAVVIPLFIRAGRAGAAPAPTAPAPEASSAVARWERLAGQRTWTVAGALVAVPVVAAGSVIAALPAASAKAITAVTVTSSGCARDWTSARAGTQTFTVTNQSGRVGEITLDNAAGGIVAEIETLGPATTAAMTATLGRGSYTFTCRLSGQAATSSAAVLITGQDQAVPAAVKPVTVRELTGPNRAYQAYAAGQLAALAGAVTAIQADLRHGDLAAARRDWLAAQLAWERVGASYDSFGADGTAVDGLPGGLPDGVHDQAFTGLHRLEYGLDDQGGGAAYPQTHADLQVTRVVLGELAPLINARAPKLLPAARPQMDAVAQALLATRAGGQWQSPRSAPLLVRQRVDAVLGALLETLAQVPDLLELPPTR